MKKIMKPNFFIIGAPKCGTTTIHKWLSEHPEVFMSKIKEPNHYNKDHNFPKYSKKNDYFKLFETANAEHTAIGEASPYYLLSNCAVDNILNENMGSKFIVCLRNPIEMMPSLFFQNKSTLIEKNIDLETGWDSRLDTLTKDSLPNLMYENICKLGFQLENLYKKAKKNQVHIIFLDDMRNDPGAVWTNLQAFLDLNFHNRQKFQSENLAKVPRSIFLNKILEFIGEKTMKYSGYGILTKIKNLNFKQKKYVVENDFKIKLYEVFKEDILMIERITERNLDKWKL